MLLRNYDLLHCISTATFKDTLISELKNKIKSVAGNVPSMTVIPSSEPLANVTITNNVGTNASKTVLLVGSNDAPVTYDDYKINLISGMTGVSVTETQTGLTDDETAFENTIKVTYCNSNNNSVFIKEIGAYQNAGSSGTSDAYQIMVYRKVLETPIEVPADANVIITLTKKVSVNPNKPVEIETDVTVFEFTGLSEYKTESGAASGYQEYLTLVNDTVLTEEQMKNATFTYVDEDGVERTTSIGNDDCTFMSLELDNGNFLAITDADGEHPFIVSSPDDNISLSDAVTFPKAGTYFSVYVDTENNNKFMFGVKKMTLATNTN